MSWIIQKLNSIKAALTFLLLTIFDWIDETMSERDEVWRRVHQNYVMIGILRKLHSIKKNCSYLSVTGDVWLNRQNNES